VGLLPIRPGSLAQSSSVLSCS